MGSRSRFAVGPRPSLAVFRQQLSRLRFSAQTRILSSTSVSLQSVPSVEPSRTVRTRRDRQPLSWTFRPYNTFRRCGSTLREPFLTRYGPPSGFVYPLDGLRPASPGRAYLIPAAFMGFRPTKRSPLVGWRSTFAPRPNLPAVNRLLASAVCTTDRRSRSRLPGFGPGKESLVRRSAIHRRRTGCSHGLLPPSGCSRRMPCRATLAAQLPFCAWPLQPKLKRRHYRVSISTRLASLAIPKARRRRGNKRDNPLEVLMPPPSAEFETSAILAYGFAARTAHRYRRPCLRTMNRNPPLPQPLARR